MTRANCDAFWRPSSNCVPISFSYHRFNFALSFVHHSLTTPWRTDRVIRWTKGDESEIILKTFKQGEVSARYGHNMTIAKHSNLRHWNTKWRVHTYGFTDWFSIYIPNGWFRLPASIGLPPIPIQVRGIRVPCTVVQFILHSWLVLLFNARWQRENAAQEEVICAKLHCATIHAS